MHLRERIERFLVPQNFYDDEVDRRARRYDTAQKVARHELLEKFGGVLFDPSDTQLREQENAELLAGIEQNLN